MTYVLPTLTATPTHLFLTSVHTVSTNLIIKIQRVFQESMSNNQSDAAGQSFS